MSPRPTRRGFLALTGKAAAAVAGAAVLPTLWPGTASARTGLPAVLAPASPEAAFLGEPPDAGGQCDLKWAGV
ncbi:MAG TPA: twin-arginine translocation signal domain-containing protein [Streptomyces sp.]|uniref:twin-arginine translocation signal domain-containing protein n=1 Tax=Streptomyces sp. TaxID=1931 RepID=UPI002D3CD7C7|nr:twin-arginine translocation signal domain-containing protein [Streptomyces sp.]HZG05142.1 twin-arginine translocation signal domain-containing protein [Streptomyces sp.]